MNGRLTAVQIVLVSVASVGWLAVVLVPLIVDRRVDTQVQVGVMGIMGVIVGAVFGVRIIKKGPGNGGDNG